MDLKSCVRGTCFLWGAIMFCCYQSVSCRARATNDHLYDLQCTQLKGLCCPNSFVDCRLHNRIFSRLPKVIQLSELCFAIVHLIVGNLNQSSRGDISRFWSLLVMPVILPKWPFSMKLLPFTILWLGAVGVLFILFLATLAFEADFIAFSSVIYWCRCYIIFLCLQDYVNYVLILVRHVNITTNTLANDHTLN